MESPNGFVTWDDVIPPVVESKAATFYWMPSRPMPGWPGNAQRLEVKWFRAGQARNPRDRFATIYIEFLPRRARKRRAAVQGSHPSLVILQGWNHPDPPDGWVANGNHWMRARWHMFAQEWRLEFDAFLEDYLRGNPAVPVLADYRAKEGSTRTEQQPSEAESGHRLWVPSRSARDGAARPSSDVTRAPRPFAAKPPQPPVRSALPPDAESLARQEKASIEHHKILTLLAEALSRGGWTEIQEIPCAVDLWARPPDGGCRVIFEAKTVTAENELIQTRHGLAQLLEYRIGYGDPTDELCLVTDHAIGPTRVGLLEKLGVAVLSWKDQDFVPSGSLWDAWRPLGRVLNAQSHHVSTACGRRD